MLSSVDLESWFGQVSLGNQALGNQFTPLKYLRQWLVNQTTNLLIYSGRFHSHDWSVMSTTQGNHLLISRSLEIKLGIRCIFLSFESEQREFDRAHNFDVSILNELCLVNYKHLYISIFPSDMIFFFFWAGVKIHSQSTILSIFSLSLYLFCYYVFIISNGFLVFITLLKFLGFS